MINFRKQLENKWKIGMVILLRINFMLKLIKYIEDFKKIRITLKMVIFYNSILGKE